MTRVIGMMALHYGKPYIASSIQSVIDVVDEFHVLYALNPSHNGGTTALPNPDTEDELRDIAKVVAGNKLRWTRGRWKYEFEQRGAIYAIAPGADIILVVDSDECYGDGLAAQAVDYAYHSLANQIRLPFHHAWRSLHKGFLHDPAYPTRVINTQKRGETVTMPTDKHVFHCGYSLPFEYMAYKWSGIHGHQSDLRPNWLEEVYKTNRQYDCHPCGNEYWNVEPIPDELIPTPLKHHIFYGLDFIP